MPFRSIPYNKIETIFLDAGNTLVSMDFSWFAEELKRFDIICTENELCRAEAAARPLVSSEMKRLKSTENQQTSIFYMQSILKGITATAGMEGKTRDEIVEFMLTTISSSGKTQRLWTYILPGVCDALEILKKKGYQLGVVSNSNGTVEEILFKLELRQYFEHVFDSHLVGLEKPDPLFFRHALKTENASPDTSLHIGDLYHVDVQGAWSADMYAILLDPFGDWDGYDCPRFPDLISFAKMMEEIQ
jgi:HAD superfamily hydrolase (TIGR01549 family)